MFEHVIECDPGDFDPAEEYPWLDLEYRKKLDKAFSLAKVPPRYSRLGLFGLSEIFADPNLTRYFAAGGRWIKEHNGRGTVFVGPKYSRRDVNLIAAGMLLKFPRYRHFVLGKNAGVSQVEGTALPSVVPLDTLLACKGREELVGALPYFGEYLKTYIFPDIGETRTLSHWDMDKVETTLRMIKDSGNTFIAYVESPKDLQGAWKAHSKGFVDYLLDPDYADVRVFD